MNGVPPASPLPLKASITEPFGAPLPSDSAVQGIVGGAVKMPSSVTLRLMTSVPLRRYVPAGTNTLPPPLAASCINRRLKRRRVVGGLIRLCTKRSDIQPMVGAGGRL